MDLVDSRWESLLAWDDDIAAHKLI
jgi:hypothetical protein